MKFGLEKIKRNENIFSFEIKSELKLLLLASLITSTFAYCFQ